MASSRIDSARARRSVSAGGGSPDAAPVCRHRARHRVRPSARTNSIRAGPIRTNPAAPKRRHPTFSTALWMGSVLGQHKGDRAHEALLAKRRKVRTDRAGVMLRPRSRGRSSVDRSRPRPPRSWKRRSRSSIQASPGCHQVAETISPACQAAWTESLAPFVESTHPMVSDEIERTPTGLRAAGVAPRSGGRSGGAAGLRVGLSRSALRVRTRSAGASQQESAHAPAPPGADNPPGSGTLIRARQAAARRRSATSRALSSAW